MAKRDAETEDVYQQETANSGLSEFRQGPFPPWCVGSVFSPPQLVTSGICPVIYNQVGKPECIISTGHEVQLQEGTDLKTSEQTQSFMLSTSLPFIPSGLLQDHLEEDAVLQKADSSKEKRYYGNRLESVKCRDGNIILFFPCGKIGEKIGSSLCFPRVDGAWYPVRNSSTSADCEDPDEAQWSVSPSFSQPILQVERIRFVATFAVTFQTHVSHVTWNPHLDREAAVLLGNGEVSLFDIPVWKSSLTNRTMDVKSKIILESPARSLREKSRYRDSVSTLALEIFEARNEQDPEKNESDPVDSLDDVWWRCEFSWHPQILLVSGTRKVVQMDYRGQCSSESAAEGAGCMNQKCLCEVGVVAKVGAPSALSRFCYMKPREEHIVAFARAEYDGMCKFSVATEKHLMLFDARRGGAPILQWEHCMIEGPPDLLIMLQASALQSSAELGKVRNHKNGRAIVAVNFQSGDIRLFFYGSKGPSLSSTRTKYSALKDFEGYDWHDVTFAWEMPLKIYPPKAVVSDWTDMLALSDVQFSKKINCSTEFKEQECISGIIILSHLSSERSARISKTAFTILQLTGSGDILLQQYKASDQSTILPFKLDSVSIAQDTNETWEAQKPKFLVLGAFFKCIHTIQLDYRAMMFIQTSGWRAVPLKEFECYTLRTFDVYGKCFWELLPAMSHHMRTGSTLVCSYADKRKFSGRAKCWASFDDVNDAGEEEMIQDCTEGIKPPAAKKKKIDSHLSQLKMVLQHLSAPLSMFEVAHTVLRMGLPSSLLTSAARLPSDLQGRRRRGYKLSSFLPLIYSEPTSESADEIISGDRFKPVPLSSLLEIRQLIKVEISSSIKSHSNKGDLEVCGNGAGGVREQVEQAEGCDIANLGQYAFGKTIVPGQKLLLETCSCVENGLKELLEKQVPSAVSVNDPKEDWLKSERDNQILLYEISTDILIKPDAVDELTLADKAQNSINVAKCDEDFDNELGRLFSEERLCKFVAGKPLTSQGEDMKDRFTSIDLEICPIKLSYKRRAEEGSLEEQEWSALESLQAQFKEWQQSFKPYCKLYG